MHVEKIGDYGINNYLLELSIILHPSNELCTIYLGTMAFFFFYLSHTNILFLCPTLPPLRYIFIY